jgi:hypothetical protein
VRCYHSEQAGAYTVKQVRPQQIAGSKHGSNSAWRRNSRYYDLFDDPFLTLQPF